MKKTRKILPAFLLVAALFPTAEALALEASELVPVGETVGIEIQMNGVLVADTNEVECAEGKKSPARSAGLCAGDLITSVNGRKVDTAAEFLSAAANFDGKPVSITANRNGKEIRFSITPAQTADGLWQLGLWLRDGVNGIGTVTFYDPASGCYGALGHGINDLKSGELVPIGSGSILDAEVTDVVRGAEGSPGELRGKIDKTRILGKLESNSLCGIFGHCSSSAFSIGAPMGVASPSEVVLGEATILSNVRGDEVKEYSVEICRVYRGNDDVRGMMLCVTDPELLSLTGGIVQGMSGSPILQRGKIIGAVTHVLVNDPTRGYGIFIEKMLDAAG
ncbi:MAG: SpoIVB peptidase [Oscillospiraceae bacterium]|nr:SpoIVB peptidase [Oscillospiraceae bacterium]